jgi:hypothetical protein
MRLVGICVEVAVTVAVLGAWVQIAASLSDASIPDSRVCLGTTCVKVPSEACRSSPATGSEQTQSRCRSPR